MRGLSMRDIISSPVAEDSDDDKVLPIDNDVDVVVEPRPVVVAQRRVEVVWEDDDDEEEEVEAEAEAEAETAIEGDRAFPGSAPPLAKTSIGFLLAPDEPANGDNVDEMMEETESDENALGPLHSRVHDDHVKDEAWDSRDETAPVLADAVHALNAMSVAHDDGPELELPKRRKKRKARICKEPGCQKYVVDHGLCIRHGGGKRCSVDECNCRAQNRGLCWKHGGYTICKVDGCTKRAKSRGICWSHGGGTRCKSDGCTKIAVSQGRCWAHGGGKRCAIDGCRKPASERTDNYCTDHFGGRPAPGACLALRSP